MPGSDLAAVFGNDEALIVVSQWHEVERSIERRSLSDLLRLSRGGKNVERIGLGEDIDAASESTTIPLVAVLERETLRIVAV